MRAKVEGRGIGSRNRLLQEGRGVDGGNCALRVFHWRGKEEWGMNEMERQEGVWKRQGLGRQE